MQAMMPPRHADPGLPGLRAVRLSATHHRSEPAFWGTLAERYQAVSRCRVSPPNPRENGTLSAGGSRSTRLSRMPAPTSARTSNGTHVSAAL